MIKEMNMKKIKKSLMFIMLTTLVVSITFLCGCKKESEEYTPSLPTNPSGGNTGLDGIQWGKGKPGTYDLLTEEEVARLKALEAPIDKAVYNVCDFGAVSGKDCTEAIRSGITALINSGGGILYFPAGKYTVTDVITLPSGETAPIIFMGEPGSGSAEITLSNKISGDAFVVESANVSFTGLRFFSKMKQHAAIRIVGDKTTIYGCSFDNPVKRSTSEALVKVCGTNGILSNVSFNLSDKTGYLLNFTKLPDIVSKHNILLDTHIGGDINGILVDSQDETAAPEDVIMTRITFLNYAGGQLDIRTVKNCTVSDCMLDQGYYYCIRLDSRGIGISGLNILRNYIAAAYDVNNTSYEKFAVVMPENDENASISNVSIIDNMIVYSQYGIAVRNPNTSRLFISGNTISGSINSMKLETTKDCTIVSNVFWEECHIGKLTGSTVFHSNFIHLLSAGSSIDEFEQDNIISKKGA